MAKSRRARFWFEFALSVASGFLGLVTLVWRDWIEAVFRLDPDRHSGALEWLIVLGLLLTAAVAGTAARVEWGRGRAGGVRVVSGS